MWVGFRPTPNKRKIKKHYFFADKKWFAGLWRRCQRKAGSLDFKPALLPLLPFPAFSWSVFIGSILMKLNDVKFLELFLPAFLLTLLMNMISNLADLVSFSYSYQHSVIHVNFYIYKYSINFHPIGIF